MSQRYIMTAFGQDRVGIVADVTEIMYQHECNLEDANMTRLSDEFAVIFLFSSQDPDLEDKLMQDCRRLEREKSITAFFRPLQEPKRQEQADLPRVTLHVEGIDQTGIVYRVSRHLADHGVNILYLNSRRSFVPQSGTALYTVDLDVEIPESMAMEAFKNGIRALGDELHVNIKIKS
jgi:glycine cleavage system transcriptional repressor